MEPTDLRRYVRNTEKNVVPGTVAMRVQGMSILRKLPRWLQNRIVERGSRTDPYMSFIVEPYAVFLAFEVTDESAAARLLPPGYRLHPSAMFVDTPARPCAIVSAFNVHTNVFWGSRVEFYLMAENAQTGLLSWIIEEYESNAPSYDPSRGFTLPSTSRSVVTTSYRGEVIVEMSSEQTGNGLALVADMSRGVRTNLDQRVWVEGNLSVDYGSDLQQSTKPFGLIFDPGEMATALKLPLEDIALCVNTFGSGMLDPKPFEAAVFPYAQHFVTTTYPIETSMRTSADLERAVNEMNDKLGAAVDDACGT
ncbi:MAG: hypothetical protein Kow0067_00800 [Coriobacteriia bacterium]